LTYLPNGRLVGTLENMNWLCDAVWIWVRGCHALLYGAYLPQSMGRNVVSPFEMFGDGLPLSFDEQLAEQATMRSMAAGICNLARQHNCLQEIRCWGGKIEFLAAWVDINPKAKGRAGWPACVWLLSTPMLGAIGETIRGVRLPWAGMYQFPITPPSARPVPRSVLISATGYRSQVEAAAKQLLPGLYGEQHTM
jgi:hypothetical protein